MINTVVSGACGNMGKKILAQFALETDVHVIAAIERKDHQNIGEELQLGLVLSPDLSFVKHNDCMVVEFSNPQATIEHLEIAVERKLPMVIGTTGFTKEQSEFVASCAKHIPILKSHNYGLGMNVFMEVVQSATRLLGGAYDIEIIESHAANKPDIPSGTGMTIAKAIAEARGDVVDEVIQYGRDSTKSYQRRNHEIGIHSLRSGSYRSVHTVIFAGSGERMEFTHHEEDSSIIAKGVVYGVRFLQGQKPGLYSMKDVLAFMQESHS